MDYATYNYAQQVKQEKYDYAQNDRRKSSKKAVNHVVRGFPKLCEVGVHSKNSLQGATSAGLRMSRPANQVKAYLLVSPRVALLAFAAASGTSGPVPLIEHRPSCCCWHCA
jgi:hypothetical protein